MIGGSNAENVQSFFKDAAHTGEADGGTDPDGDPETKRTLASMEWTKDGAIPNEDSVDIMIGKMDEALDGPLFGRFARKVLGLAVPKDGGIQAQVGSMMSQIQQMFSGKAMVKAMVVGDKNTKVWFLICDLG